VVKALAVDLGGSHASCAVVEGERVLACREVALEAVHGLGPALPAIATALRNAASAAGCETGDCAGVGFGFCGLVDSDASRVLSTNAKYEDATRLDLGAWAREAFGLRLRLENDARLALLGERHAGAARGCADVVMMTLGTGIGGAAMIGGRLLRGRHHQAGVLGGHLGGNTFGRRCTCGNAGCAEAEASTWALPGVARDWPGFAASSLAAAPRLDFASLFDCAEAGDAVAAAIRERCLRVWGAAAVSMIHAWDPEVLVVGGGVMARATVVLPAVEDHVHAHAWTPWGKVDVRAAALGSRAALLGAVPLLAEAQAGG
jgi:glucokinase